MDFIHDSIVKMESNIDDSSGEIMGYLMDRLLEAGARDVNYHPIFMKKNRPAYQLNVICDESKVEMLAGIIFSETTTIGIRYQTMERLILPREIRMVNTPIGEALVKVCRLPGGDRAYPEYESAASLAKEYQMPLPEVYDMIREAYDRLEEAEREDQ